METLITAIHVTVIFLLVIVVLIQSGKGAEISASFGGSSQTIFGSSGGANFFTKFTAGLATAFMVTSLVLTVMGGQSRKSVFDSMPTTPAATSEAPASAAGAAKDAPADAGKTAPAAPAKK